MFSGDAVAAARQAGYRNCEQLAGDLLGREHICAEIESLFARQKKLIAKAAQGGYYRLAFGSIADAVSLLYMQQPDLAQLQKMDLFLVSEIRRPKDGAMEIKFFDRVKALEKLAQGGSDTQDAQDIFDAIGRNARRTGSDGDD